MDSQLAAQEDLLPGRPPSWEAALPHPASAREDLLALATEQGYGHHELRRLLAVTNGGRAITYELAFLGDRHWEQRLGCWTTAKTGDSLCLDLPQGRYYFLQQDLFAAQGKAPVLHAAAQFLARESCPEALLKRPQQGGGQ